MGRYSVIVADPEWGKDSLDGIDGLAADDCVLWLWTPSRWLKRAMDTASAMGFEYQTALTVVRKRATAAFLLRDQTDHCLLFIKGSPKVNQSKRTTALPSESNGRPDEFWHIAESICSGRRLDMFGSPARVGWHGTRNEATIKWEDAVNAALQKEWQDVCKKVPEML